MADQTTETGNQNLEHVPMHTPEVPRKEGHLGPALAVIVVMLVIILIGLYLWGGMLADEAPSIETPIVNNEPETPRATADAEIMETLSPSDDLSAIEADISSTNFDLIEADLNAIDAELNAVGSNQ